MILRLLFVVRRRWPILVAVPVLAAMIGLLLGPRSESNQSNVYVSNAVISANQAAANQTEIQQALVKATQGPSAQQVADLIGDGTTAKEVQSAVETDFDLDTFVVKIKAHGDTKQEAEAYAKAFGEVFVASGNGGASSEEKAAIDAAVADRDAAKAELQEFLSVNAAALAGEATPALLLSEQAGLENAYNATEAALSNLQTTLRPTDVYELISVNDAHLQAPSKLQVLSDPKFRMGLGFQLGLLAAALIVFIAERMNPRIDDPAQAEEIVGAPVLAMVPVLGRRRRNQIERVDPEEFKGPYAEAFRTMRAHLDFRAAAAELDKPPRIMVTSATPSEGKSTTAAFLALSFAESDRSPVVIGGDLRRPSIHRLFGVDRMPGLTTRSLPGGRDVPLTDIVRRDPVSGVTLVPSGPSVDHVNDVMRDLIAVSEVAHGAGQVVILDTAPIRVANDAIDFLVAVDWVVVVVQAGKSTTRSVTQMMHTLRMNGAEVVGVVMLGSVESSDASRDYYSYYAPETRTRRERKRDERAVAVAAAS